MQNAMKTFAVDETSVSGWVQINIIFSLHWVIGSKWFMIANLHFGIAMY